MKALKWIGLIILILAVVLFVVSLFLPSKISIEAEVTVKAPVSVVFEQVNNFQNWSKWDPWNEKDSSMVIKLEGSEKGVGAIMSWTSDNEGNGSMEIKELVPNESIVMALTLLPSTEEHENLWSFTETEEGTGVKWSFNLDLGLNPMAKYYFALSGKKTMDEYFERGLNNMKDIAESIPVVPEIPVEIKEFPEQKFVTVKDRVASTEMHDFFGMAYGKIGEFLGMSQIQPTGMPAAFYHSWTKAMDTFVVEAAMPVSLETELEPTEGLNILELPAGKAATLIHYGNYNTTGTSWDALMNYVLSNKLEMNGPAYEVYLNDPGMEPDTSKWMTQLIQPVK